MVVNDHKALKLEKEKYHPLPLTRQVDSKDIYANYKMIKQDVKDIVESVMEEILNDSGRRHFVVRKS